MMMSHAMCLLAAARPPGSDLPSPAAGSSQELLVVLIAVAGAGLLVLGALTLWLKGRRSRHRHHRRHTRPETLANAVEQTEEPDELPQRHRRRRRRREHRPRNPTLAETGGLPPPRPQGQAPSGL
jgi:hypothetical protein